MDFAALFQKIKENIFLIPAERFDSLTTDKSYKDSFVYLLVCLTLSFPIRWVVTLLEYKEPTVLGSILVLTPFETKVVAAFLSTLIGTIMAIPLIYLLYLVQHFLLKIFGANEGLLKSIQVFIYGSTVELLFGSIPLVGIVTSLAVLSNVVLGTARVHRIEWWKAVLALVVIPTIIVVVLLVVLIFIVHAMVNNLMV